MRLWSRLDKLARSAEGLPVPGRLEIVACVPLGCDAADGRPPGTYPNADGAVATVVYAGPDPDPAVLADLKSRLAPWGLTVVSRPDAAGRPADGPASG